MRCGWLWLPVFCAYLSFLKNKQLGCWPRKVTPFRIAAGKDKDGASWLQIGLLAQSLPRCRSRHACVCAYVHVVCGVVSSMCMRVCVHVYAYGILCIRVYVTAYIYVHFFCMECCAHFGTVFLGTSACADVYVIQVLVGHQHTHLQHTCCRVCTYVYVHIYVYAHD